MNPNEYFQDKGCMLIVDDDSINREVLKNIFESNFRVVEAENGQEGLQIIEARLGELRAILLDVQMPVMDGMELLKILHERNIPRKVPVFLITATEEMKLAKSAYDMGVMGVISKPIVQFVVERRVLAVMELYQAREALTNKVEHQEQTIRRNVKTIDALHRSTLEAMASAIEFRDVESGEHTNRIYAITKMLLEKTEMGTGFSQENIENMAIGSIMHDVGKIAISDVILNKPGRLTRDEYETMKLHTVKGGELMARLMRSQEHPSYLYAQDIARHHHERWDGRGYPDGLKGDEITVWSQVVSIADVYDALVSPRVYKKALAPDEAVRMICNNECGVFNPRLLSCFMKIEPELRKTLYASDEKTPAAAVPAIPEEANDEAVCPRDPMDTILLTAAVEQYYDIIICADLTRNSYYLLEDEHARFQVGSRSGCFDQLVREGALNVQKSHRQRFTELFSRDHLLKAYAEGKKSVSFVHPWRSGDGTINMVATHALLMEDPRNGNIRSITLVRFTENDGQPSA